MKPTKEELLKQLAEAEERQTRLDEDIRQIMFNPTSLFVANEIGLTHDELLETFEAEAYECIDLIADLNKQIAEYE